MPKHFFRVWNAFIIPERFFRVWGALVLSVCLCAVSVCASGVSTENGGLFQEYMTGENGMYLLVNSPEEDLLSPEQFSVTLNDSPVEVSGVEYADALPVTWYCVVDVSGSLNQEQLQQEKDVLKALRAGLAENDRMVIALLGNELTPGGYLSTADDIDAVIDAIEIQSGEDTNLYGGIASAIQELRTSKRSTLRKCLVVLSDGQDDQKFSFTLEETDRAVRESRIPFYGVAVMKSAQSGNAEKIAYAKILGSFARESTGGVYYNPVLDGISATSAGEHICTDMRTDLCVALDFSGMDQSVLANGTGTLPLKVNCTTETSTYNFSVAVDTADLRAVLPEQTVPSPDHSQSINRSGTDENDENDVNRYSDPVPVWVWIVTGFVISALVIILAVLVVRIFKTRQKNAGRENHSSGGNENDGKGDVPVHSGVTEEIPANGSQSGGSGNRFDGSGVNGSGNQFDGSGVKRTGGSVIIFDPPHPVEPLTHKVIFNALNYRNVRIEIEIPEGKSATLGRTSRADIVLNAEDDKLSGVHCRILLQDGHLLVWDADSKNGTMINGVSIRNGGCAVLENGQTLRAGSYEYRADIL